MQGRRKYDRDFKEGAVRLVIDGGKPVRDLARDLGINENMLYRWKSEYLKDREDAFPGQGRLKPQDEEIWKLRRRVEDLEEEREILKKALAIFSKHRR